MKPVFKCDYCNHMGIEEEIKEHESKCMDNYDRRSCYTCIHKQIKPKDGKYIFECKVGKEIPPEKIFEFCELYERKMKSDSIFGDFFGSLFGK